MHRPTTLLYEVHKAKSRAKLFRQPGFPRFGRYVVLDMLGRGGMGVVFKAYDATLERHVALKLLNPDNAAGHAGRLRREARALARLSHPNVLQVFEIGDVDDQPFVAMELVDGQTLREWQRQQPRPGWRQCVEVYRGAGQGLAAAHAAGLVHRDFKPSNCIVDEERRARVLDFGLVVWDDRETDDDMPYPDAGSDDATVETSRTETGTLMGTLAYMSPEQLERRSAHALSDQFSFCVSLYEALYGENPFDGDTHASRALALHHGRIRPAPAGTRVPARLRRVVLRGLAPKPSMRWPSMKVLLAVLDQILAAPRRRWRLASLGALGGGLLVGPVVQLGTPPSSSEPPPSRCVDPKVRLGGIWDGARRVEVRDAILSTGVSYAPTTWARVEREFDDYAEQWARGHTEACEATWVNMLQTEHDLALRMRCLSDRRIELRETVAVLARTDGQNIENAVSLVSSLPSLARCEDLAALQAEVPPPDEPEHAAVVDTLREQLVRVRTQREAGEYRASERLADAVTEQAEPLGYEPLLAEALLERGETRAKLARLAEAARDFKRASSLATRLEHRQVQTRAAIQMTRVAVERAELKIAREWSEWALALASRDGIDERSRAEALLAAGITLEEHGDYERALEYLEQAMAAQRATLGHQHPSVAETSGHIGRLLLGQRRLADATTILEQALDPQQNARGQQHPSIARAVFDIGSARLKQGKLDEALQGFQRALAIYEPMLGSEHPSVARALNAIAVVRLKQGRFDEALEHVHRALAILQAGLRKRHPAIGDVLSTMGVVYRRQGHLDEALEAHQRALAIYEASLGLEHPKLIGMLSNIGFVLRDQGRFDEALKYYHRSVTVRRAVLGPEHESIGWVLSNIGHELRAQGRLREATEHYRQALAHTERSLGLQHPRVAMALIGLAEVALLQGDAHVAREYATRVLSIVDAAQARPPMLARARFLLAQALWPEISSRPRALELATQVRDDFAAMGPAHEDEIARVDRWLEQRRPPGGRRQTG